MKATDAAKLLLEAHSKCVSIVDIVGGCQIRPMLRYSGIMARTAYDGWKKYKNKGRLRVGCMDFKIYFLEGDQPRPLLHPALIERVKNRVTLESAERVFAGDDPLSLSCADDVVSTLCTLQLAMLEQEVNWGDEDFQTWTHFSPRRGLRPRDFITAYVRRVYSEPDFLRGIESITAASGTQGTLPPPLDTKVWGRYLEPSTSSNSPWLSGSLLDEYRMYVNSLPNNPAYLL